MRILVIGSGGREHALVWSMAKSPRVEKIFAAPGNAGIEDLAEGIPLGVDKAVELADFAASNRIDLTVVGPEAPLVHGIVDYFQSRGLAIFGPTKAAARLEGSKAFTKTLLAKLGVATAPFKIFEELDEALSYIEKADLPIVVKADGLAAGKGAIVSHSRQEAAKAVTSILKERVFGEAGSRVVIEECLSGEEISVLALSDGRHCALLAPSQDHKRALDQDQGPNTGGMGAYSPVPMVEPKGVEEILRKIFEPVVREMSQQGTPFVGVLYAGLMLTESGPQVLEFNVRFGDPEAQAILPRLETDLVELILGCLEGKVNQVPLRWDFRSSACVVLASGGYPGKYDIGREIRGLKEASDLPDTLLFHAGTKREGGRLLTWGGRVLNVVGLGDTLEAALERAYQGAARISFEGMRYRRDIGARALRYGGVR